MSEILVHMEGITKQFPGVMALNGCRFELRKGEVHALMGENGAGKSTMMKILTGVYQKDEGSITYKGRTVEINHPKTAQDAGISMIHQELNLAPDLTVAQNIYIGREPRRKLGLFLDEKALNRQVEALFERMGLVMDPSALVADLTVARQQMVEIAKALSYNADVLVMDEPTAALSEAEIEDLFRIIRQLRAEGVGIVYISHRMDEIKRITDRITVMRDGQYIATVPTAEVSTQDIISMMVGRQIYDTSKPEGVSRDRETVLEVQGVSRGRVLSDVSFTLKKEKFWALPGWSALGALNWPG